ncbi:unnamed protein product, partial [Musa acuminata subsp. burmannicoides]
MSILNQVDETFLNDQISLHGAISSLFLEANAIVQGGDEAKRHGLALFCIFSACSNLLIKWMTCMNIMKWTCHSFLFILGKSKV